MKTGDSWAKVTADWSGEDWWFRGLPSEARSGWPKSKTSKSFVFSPTELGISRAATPEQAIAALKIWTATTHSEYLHALKTKPTANISQIVKRQTKDVLLKKRRFEVVFTRTVVHSATRHVECFTVAEAEALAKMIGVDALSWSDESELVCAHITGIVEDFELFL